MKRILPNRTFRRILNKTADEIRAEADKIATAKDADLPKIVCNLRALYLRMDDLVSGTIVPTLILLEGVEAPHL